MSMQDIENAAKDRYELDKKILAELNAGNIEEAKAIIKEDMKIIEDDLSIEDDSDNKKELSTDCITIDSSK